MFLIFYLLLWRRKLQSNEGLELEYSTNGMPAKQKIARKPKGVGMELKSVADGDTGCILCVEMHEGKQ